MLLTKKQNICSQPNVDWTNVSINADVWAGNQNIHLDRDISNFVWICNLPVRDICYFCVGLLKTCCLFVFVTPTNLTGSVQFVKLDLLSELRVLGDRFIVCRGESFSRTRPVSHLFTHSVIKSHFSSSAFQININHFWAPKRGGQYMALCWYKNHISNI